MKYFQDIPKEWKQARTEKRCEHCNKPIAVDKDHFTVHAHWKIKDEADTYSFCCIACLGMWTQEESLVEV